MDVNSLQKTSFDDIVIGSSPLMLLQAGVLAREGRSVCLVERESENKLGGSWQIATLDNDDRVEIACHLIEFFPGVYELLEGASGAPFESLEAQPVRVHRFGFIVPYSSRILMLASGIRLILGLLYAKLNIAIGRTKDRNRLINFKKKFSSYIRHQGSAFFQRPVMQGPKHGFVDFMDRLVKRSKLDGVEFRQFDVLSMVRREDKRWHLSNKDNQTLSAEHVHCTTSTNLRLVADGKFEAKNQDFAHRLSVVVELPKQSVKISQTYVAFWADPIVSRISRIDMPQSLPYERYLVEFHNQDIISQNNWHFKIGEYMERAKIIGKDGQYKIVGQVNCLFTTNIDQLPAGEIDKNLWGYYSMGNLAAGLAAWRKNNRIPTLSNKNLSEKTGALHVD